MAQWVDIDFNNCIWKVPANDTKTKVEHTVPLSPQAINFLKELQQSQTLEGTTSSYLFPSPKGKPLSDMALSELMKDMKKRGEYKSAAVPHGFRATFRTWMAEQTNYPDEIRRAANGHKVSDTVKASYERTDFFEKRREVMNEWSKFLEQPSYTKSNTVVPIRKEA
jgi:integrase